MKPVTFEEVEKAVAESLNQPVPIPDDYPIDSLEYVEVTLALEEHFDVLFVDSDIDLDLNLPIHSIIQQLTNVINDEKKS